MCDVSLVSLHDVCRLLQGGCAGCVGAVHKCNDPQRAGVTRHRHTTPQTNRGIVLATASLTTSQAGHLHDHHTNPNPATQSDVSLRAGSHTNQDDFSEDTHQPWCRAIQQLFFASALTFFSLFSLSGFSDVTIET